MSGQRLDKKMSSTTESKSKWKIQREKRKQSREGDLKQTKEKREKGRS